MITWRTEEWPLARFLAVSPAEFNPKTPDADEIEKLAEDYRVFGVGRSFAVRADGLLLDGHQSLYAFGRLMRGEHLVRGKPVVWTTAPAVVSVRVASGMSDAVARAFVAAVNARRVEVDPAKYSTLLREVTELVAQASDDDRAFYESAVAAIGHGPDELAALIGPPIVDGGGARTKGSPRVTFEFTSSAVRDQVKTLVAEANTKDLPAGDVLAKLLGVKVSKERRR